MFASFLHASEISPNHCQRISSSPGMFRAENKLSLVSRQCYEQFSESALLCFALAWMGLYTHTSFTKFIRSICAQRYSATYLSKKKISGASRYSRKYILRRLYFSCRRHPAEYIGFRKYEFQINWDFFSSLCRC